MAPEVLHRVIYGTSSPTPFQKSLLTIRPAILHSYIRHKVLHVDYPAIIPSNTSSCVRGTLVTGLTDGDIWRLDIFEGDEYDRRSVTVYPLETVGDDAGKGNVEGNEAVVAQTYVWIAGEKRLEKEEWDFGAFVREKMWRWAGKEAENEGEFNGMLCDFPV